MAHENFTNQRNVTHQDKNYNDSSPNIMRKQTSISDGTFFTLHQAATYEELPPNSAAQQL